MHVMLFHQINVVSLSHRLFHVFLLYAHNVHFNFTNFQVNAHSALLIHFIPLVCHLARMQCQFVLCLRSKQGKSSVNLLRSMKPNAIGVSQATGTAYQGRRSEQLLANAGARMAQK